MSSRLKLKSCSSGLAEVDFTSDRWVGTCHFTVRQRSHLIQHNKNSKCINTNLSRFNYPSHEGTLASRISLPLPTLTPISHLPPNGSSTLPTSNHPLLNRRLLRKITTHHRLPAMPRHNPSRKPHPLPLQTPHTTIFTNNQSTRRRIHPQSESPNPRSHKHQHRHHHHHRQHQQRRNQQQ